MDIDHILTDLDFSLDFEVRQEQADALSEQIFSASVDTRAALDDFESKADEFQQTVINSQCATIRLIAPAGSGKTQTMINRALQRIKMGVKLERILLLTFDNAAASSLKTKLREETDALSGTGAARHLQGLNISTLNAFGYGILRQDVPGEYKPLISGPQPFRLLRHAKQALRERSPERYAGLPRAVEDRFFLDFFSILKNQIFDPRNPRSQDIANYMMTAPTAEPFFANPSDVKSIQQMVQTILWLFQAQERLLQRDGVIDFDDQKLRAYQCLADDVGLLRAVRNRYSEMVVDEFQDINKLDFELIREIATDATLVVTGDDDQAIYGFRGCTPDYIIDLEQHLGRPVASYQLRNNYRCPANIVRHADQLIRKNSRRIPKEPIAIRREEANIKVVSALSAGLEAKSIVSVIQHVLGETPQLQPDQIAVLYRTNAQSLPIQIEFILNSIPYSVRDEDNIVGNEIVARMLATLRTKLALKAGRQPTLDDQVQAIRAYFRFLDPSDQSRVRTTLQRSSDFLSAVRSPEFNVALPKAESSSLSAAIDQFLSARTLLEDLDVLGKRFNGLIGMVGSLEDAIAQKAPLVEMVDVAAGFPGAAQFVRTLDDALDRAKQTRAGKDEGGVRLRTYFRAKGLQWHTVILTTCNDGLIPHRRAPVEEERRLFYVALTRASSNLMVSYLKNACNEKVVPSRFLGEAGLL